MHNNNNNNKYIWKFNGLRLCPYEIFKPVPQSYRLVNNWPITALQSVPYKMKIIIIVIIIILSEVVVVDLLVESSSVVESTSKIE